MELTNRGITNKEIWQEAGFSVPQYNREKIKNKTMTQPTWIHFGAGNIFRAFPAVVVENLLNEGKIDEGLIVAEGYDYEIIEKMNRPHDDLGVAVTLKANGTIEKAVIGSVIESLTMDEENEEDFNRLKEIFRAPSLQMVSFTITEKGYSLVSTKDETLEGVTYDFKKGPNGAKSYMGKLTALCYERYLNGKLPLALVSMDNCSHNGTKLFEAVRTFAKSWVENNLVEENFLAYIENPEIISFPWSMIDKITPRPDESVKQMLIASGFKNVEPIITSKNTYVASFVNAEESQYLIIEDHFPNGRPPLEAGGIIFTTRETVDRVEKMKVCTCLNPLHTALAIFGCLLSYKNIYKEMEDIELKKLVEGIGYREGLPVVVNPGIIDPKTFLDEVLQIRIPNPFMPDTPQRIATDTSQKIPIRFGETIKAYMQDEKLDVRELKFIPLVLAGWCRYLMGINDFGEKFEMSADPLLDSLHNSLKEISLGQREDVRQKLQPILSRKDLFGVNLYEAGLGKKVEGYFEEFISCKRSIRMTLKKYV